MANNEMTDAEKAQQRRNEVAQHNAAISAQIYECEVLKGKYNSVMTSALGIVGAIQNLVTSLREVNTLLEKIIISGTPVGNGELLNDCSTLDSIRSTFIKISSVCTEKISELERKISDLKTQYWSY